MPSEGDVNHWVKGCHSGARFVKTQVDVPHTPTQLWSNLGSRCQNLREYRVVPKDPGPKAMYILRSYAWCSLVYLRVEYKLRSH